PAAEGAEDVAPHADGRGDEDEEPGKIGEGAGDGAEGQPGEEVTAGRNEEGGQTLTQGGRGGPQEGAKASAGAASESTHDYSAGPPSRPPNLAQRILRVSPLSLGTYLLDGDADEHALVAFHGPAVVVPVGVLAGDAAVVGDEAVHGLGQGHDRRPAGDQQPLPVELAGQTAQPHARVAAQVLDLVGRLP